MALIRSLTEASRDAGPDRSEVDAEWARVRTPDGILLKISTFGSDDRVSERKQSQVITIDRDTARELIAIFRATFGPLD